MLCNKQNPKPIAQKVAEFLDNNECCGVPINIDKQLFNGGNYFANPSAPFIYNGKTVMAVRDCTKSETEDKSIFLFEDTDHVWKKLSKTCEFALQDPFMSIIDKEFIFGGVKGWKVDEQKWTWLCEFYRGKNLEKFSHILTGPTLMKDIRLVGLENGKIGIFTRPQGILYRHYSGHIADIGYTEVDNLDVMDSVSMVKAPILDGVFLPNEWGGVNQVYQLNNGLLGIIGHCAYGEGEFREGLVIHYFGMAFAFNPKTREFTEPKIIAARNNFEFMRENNSRNSDVIFSGGIIRKSNGTATFFSGVADSFIGCMEIPDPFIEYENLVL